MQESTERLELQGQTTVLTPRLDYKLFFFAWKICIKYQIYQTKNFKASFMPTNRHKGSKEITSRYVQSYVVKNSLRYRSHFTWLFHHSGGSVWLDMTIFVVWFAGFFDIVVMILFFQFPVFWDFQVYFFWHYLALGFPTDSCLHSILLNKQRIDD